MTKLGDCIVRGCLTVHTVPAQVSCVLLFIVQAASLDFFLYYELSKLHLIWIVPDTFNLSLLVACICMSSCTLGQCPNQQSNSVSFAWVCWLLVNIMVAAKTIVIFNEVANKLEEEDESFFGPNVLKTTIALGSCIFVLLLTTQHDAQLGSERRLYIEELTGTVVFDILDTVDILDILFDETKTVDFWQGLTEFILGVATINLLIPTVPLLILSRTNFGHSKLEKHLVYVHRLLQVLAVNVPNLLVRFIIWHGFSAAISPFSLKNIILICMTFYEFYLHKKEKYAMHHSEMMKVENNTENTNHLKGGSRVDATTVDIERPPKEFIEESFRIESRVETCL